MRFFLFTAYRGNRAGLDTGAATDTCFLIDRILYQLPAYTCRTFFIFNMSPVLVLEIF